MGGSRERGVRGVGGRFGSPPVLRVSVIPFPFFSPCSDALGFRFDKKRQLVYGLIKKDSASPGQSKGRAQGLAARKLWPTRTKMRAKEIQLIH